MNINDFIITFAKALKADYFFKNIKKTANFIPFLQFILKISQGCFHYQCNCNTICRLFELILKLYSPCNSDSCNSFW